jgi:hypothetical protein
MKIMFIQYNRGYLRTKTDDLFLSADSASAGFSERSRRKQCSLWEWIFVVLIGPSESEVLIRQCESISSTCIIDWMLTFRERKPIHRTGLNGSSIVTQLPQNLNERRTNSKLQILTFLISESLEMKRSEAVQLIPQITSSSAIRTRWEEGSWAAVQSLRSAL